jgi:hypothetical protein
MAATRDGLAAVLIVLGLSSAVDAQIGEPTPAPTTPSEPSGQPGRFRLGPVYLTPRFRISSLGVDTNVFYTASDRRTDFIAHGGPGLEMVVPLHGDLKLRADGNLGYLYYARTASQRRLTGGALGRLAYEGLRLTTGAEYVYTRSYSRLGFEVDRRVAQRQQRAQADLRYRVGERLALGARGFGERTQLDEGQEFFGADLRRNLDRDTYGGAGNLSYALTPKTSFVVEGDHQADRFKFDDSRDADSNRLGAGLVIVSTSYFSGRAMAGARSFRVLSLPDEDRVEPFANVELTYHFGPRTSITGLYSRDIGFSAFSVAAGDLPTLTTESYGVRLEKGLWGRLDLRLHGAVTQLKTDAPVLIETPTDGPQSVRRNDRAREAGADLGYAFWTRLRIGLAATYAERRSAIADLGIEGLLLGGTVTFIPN